MRQFLSSIVVEVASKVLYSRQYCSLAHLIEPQPQQPSQQQKLPGSLRERKKKIHPSKTGRRSAIPMHYTAFPARVSTRAYKVENG